MCGITAILSKNNENIINHVIKSLSIIQNRGYDSTGIAMKLARWEIIKYASTEVSDSIHKLSETVKNKSSAIAIAHTRWATHGSKTDINSHPLKSMYGNIILVHNGIINNFNKIKDFLIDKGYIFVSETDSEVIANLIEYYLLNNNSINKAIELASKQLCGTWALVIIYTLEPNNIYVTRHGSPILLGYNDNMIMCTSELSGFIGLVYNYIILDNNDIITISQDGYKSQNVYIPKTINYVYGLDTPEPYDHWTIKEIHDQSKSIMSAYNNGARILNNNIVLGGLKYLNDIIEKSGKIEHVILLGCGTSYHAAMIGKNYFYNSTDSNIFTTIQAFDASEFNKRDIPKYGNVLCIVCSQSGETSDLIRCISLCKERKCILMGVVNVVDSLISRGVDCGVYLNAGSEIAVASTKSFTSMLIVLSLIGMWFKEKYRNIPIINTLRTLPETVDKLLNNNTFKNKCDEIVYFINSSKIKSIFILGKGKLFPVSKEISLKIKEITYIHAEGYSSSSLKHGPFALLDKNTVTFLLIDNKNTEQLLSTYYEIVSRDTHCIVVSDDNSLINIAGNILKIPKLSCYQEVIFSIALQYLSYKLSISKNINPDKPRNLAKVVTVE